MLDKISLCVQLKVKKRKKICQILKHVHVAKEPNMLLEYDSSILKPYNLSKWQIYASNVPKSWVIFKRFGD